MPPILFLENPFFCLPPIYVWVFQVLFFPQVFSLEPCMHLSSTLCMPHALSISIILTLSPKYYVVRSTDHEVPHDAVFSSPLLAVRSRS